MKLTDESLFRQQCYVNGAWVDARESAVMQVTNPANGERLGQVPSMGATETRGAIDAAAQAWPAWRGLTAGERGRILRRWSELMLEHREDLARLMTAE